MLPFVLGILVIRVRQNMVLSEIQDFLESLLTYC